MLSLSKNETPENIVAIINYKQQLQANDLMLVSHRLNRILISLETSLLLLPLESQLNSYII